MAINFAYGILTSLLSWQVAQAFQQGFQPTILAEPA